MEKEEIKKMFLLNAQVRMFNTCDPRREPILEELKNMTRRYKAEVLAQADDVEQPKQPKESIALGYLSELFAALDECEAEKDHENMIKLRNEVWDTVSTAVQVYYQHPDCAAIREHIDKITEQARAFNKNDQP